MKKRERVICLVLSATVLLNLSCRDHEEEEPVSPVEPATVSYTWPSAEHDASGIILVSSPGYEFTFGNMEKAAEEHRNLVEVLEKNRIKVVNMKDIIDDMPPDSQRTAQQMIVPNLYFTRDPFIVTPKGVVIGKMRNQLRRREPELAAMCLHHLGIEPVYKICGEEAVLEGGDYLPFGTMAFVASGLRTNRAAIDEMMAADVLGHDTIVVVNDRKLWNNEMHLDTYFNIIDRNLVTIVKDRLNAKTDEIYYLPVEVFARDGKAGERYYRKIESDLSLEEFLTRRAIRIIPVTVFDARTFANNFLCIAPRHIVAVDGQSKELQQMLKEAGVQVDWIPMKELLKGNGAIHCMTKVLKTANTSPHVVQ